MKSLTDFIYENLYESADPKNAKEEFPIKYGDLKNIKAWLVKYDLVPGGKRNFRTEYRSGRITFLIGDEVFMTGDTDVFTGKLEWLIPWDCKIERDYTTRFYDFMTKWDVARKSRNKGTEGMLYFDQGGNDRDNYSYLHATPNK